MSYYQDRCELFIAPERAADLELGIAAEVTFYSVPKLHLVVWGTCCGAPLFIAPERAATSAKRLCPPPTLPTIPGRPCTLD